MLVVPSGWCMHTFSIIGARSRGSLFCVHPPSPTPTTTSIHLMAKLCQSLNMHSGMSHISSFWVYFWQKTQCVEKNGKTLPRPLSLPLQYFTSIKLWSCWFSMVLMVFLSMMPMVTASNYCRIMSHLVISWNNKLIVSLHWKVGGMRSSIIAKPLIRNLQEVFALEWSCCVLYLTSVFTMSSVYSVQDTNDISL